MCGLTCVFDPLKSQTISKTLKMSSFCLCHVAGSGNSNGTNEILASQFGSNSRDHFHIHIALFFVFQIPSRFMVLG